MCGAARERMLGAHQTDRPPGGPAGTAGERAVDGRLDVAATALARGATRRQALRLAGGGSAGALLAAVGLTDLAGVPARFALRCRKVCAASSTSMPSG